MNDLKFAIRQLVKNPGFTAVAVLILAVGIGLNTAVFSCVYSVMLRSLPVPDSEQLVSVRAMIKRGEWRRTSFSSPDFRDYRAQTTRTFSGFSAYSDATFIISGHGEAANLPGETVSHDFFKTLGITPALGRTFLAAEDAVPNRDRVAILSDELWRNRFGSGTQIPGLTIKLDGQDYEVVGVMPPGFRGLNNRAQLWVPLAMGGSSLWDNRGGRWLEAVGRLKPGVTMDAAQTEMKVVGSRVTASNPTPNTEVSASLAPLQEELFGKMRRPLLVLFGAAGFLLAITCANITNLMIVRLVGRRREIAIRLSLGASRGSLAHLYIVESLGISLAGAAFGAILAWYLIATIKHLAPVDLSNGMFSLGLHWPAFSFAFVAAILCAIAVAALPAIFAGRTNLDAAMKEGGRGSHSGTVGARTRAMLVTGEIAVSLMLLAVSTLFARSFVNLVTQEPGYRTDQLLLQRLTLVGERYNTQGRTAFIQEVISRAVSLPDIVSVALSSDTPLDGEASASFISMETRLNEPSASEGRAYLHSITPTFFQTLGIPILRGSLFDQSYGSEHERVAIVSDSLARRFWPNEDAIGKRIRIGRGDFVPWTRIIAIAGETRYRRFTDSATDDPDIYVPFYQRPGGNITIAAHTKGTEKLAAGSLRELVHSIDPNLAVSSSSITERIGRVTVAQRMTAGLMGLFAVFALILAATGLYSVVSFAVGQRRREIGVRMALGAKPLDILRLVCLGAGRLLVTGLATGLFLSFLLTRLIDSLLFGIDSRDPITFGGVSVGLAVTALLATWVPAQRAIRMDPMEALRTE